MRNAAGKAFQAWKAYLGALAAEHRERLRDAFPGARKVRSGDEEVEVEEVDIVIALVPTTAMLKISALLAGTAGGDVAKNTALALQLHRYQYNGPDPEGYLTDIPDDRTGAHLTCALIQHFAEQTGDLYGKVCGKATTTENTLTAETPDKPTSPDNSPFPTPSTGRTAYIHGMPFRRPDPANHDGGPLLGTPRTPQKGDLYGYYQLLTYRPTGTLYRQFPSEYWYLLTATYMSSKTFAPPSKSP